ncbi:copper resistance protein CopC [Dactylosporangium sp. AC04546]|uniref:copper resistance CopC family protein n=1 Tax=Dactylosporangium sp. AC04546 TaxID=2862460 RepID=UPI001EDE7FA9|nr:copper resistance protein CopC [Dactylosporangium sp. AC04546]WVK79709.1 copper resistance protein CopC [Dactylosporangium sp. AC04546]
MKLRRLLVATLLGATATLGLAAPASAHSTLVRSDPAKGATVTTPVATVTLTFNEMVKQSRTTVTVTGPDGASYSDGAARVVDKNVLQAVRALPPGAISVAWSTVSADGDAISGTFAFTNAAPAPSLSPSPSAPASPTAAPTSASATPVPVPTSSEDSGSAAWWIAGAAVLVVLLGGGFFWSRRRRTG